MIWAGAFLPLLLEQLARERGVFFSDRSKPCVDHASNPPSDGSATKLLIRVDDGQKDQCIISYLGADVTTASFAMYTSSAAVVVQAITLICVSSFADYGMLSSEPCQKVHS
jgi:UMF1 family MFS transporter